MPTNELFADDLDLFIDPDKDYLSELVGEGKKFADPQALARSKAEADAHIARIEQEQKRLRDELATRISYEAFLDKLKTSEGPVPPQQPSGGEPEKPTTSLKPEDIEKLLDQKMRQRELEVTATQNLQTVVSKLKEVYGPNYAHTLKKQIDDLDMPEKFVENLAAANPKALFKMLGITEEKPKTDNLFQAPPRTQDTSFKPSLGTKRGDSYYEDLRKKDPNTYWSPKIQNEIYARVKEDPDGYYKS